MALFSFWKAFTKTHQQCQYVNMVGGLQQSYSEAGQLWWHPHILFRYSSWRPTWISIVSCILLPTACAISFLLPFARPLAILWSSCRTHTSQSFAEWNDPTLTLSLSFIRQKPHNITLVLAWLSINTHCTPFSKYPLRVAPCTQQGENRGKKETSTEKSRQKDRELETETENCAQVADPTEEWEEVRGQKGEKRWNWDRDGHKVNEIEKAGMEEIKRRNGKWQRQTCKC